jgi:Dolichyl-phosphate-mannose-protein mannosyltransferase
MRSPTTKSPLRSVELAGAITDLLLLLFVVAGLVARVIGLPLHVADSGDEWGNTVAPLRLLYEHGDPNVFLHPALYYYVTAAAYAALYWVSKLIGVVGAADSMTDIFVHDQRFFIFAARGVSLASAVLAIGALYAFGRSLWGRRAGLAAAALLAVLPLHVFYSKTARVDSLFLFVFLCAFFHIARMADRPTPRTYTSAGLLTGFAIGANYNGGILLPWLIAAHFLGNGVCSTPGGGRNGAAKPPGWDLVRALLLIVVAFIVCNPFTVLNFETFGRNFAHQSGLLLGTHPGWEDRHLLYYAEFLARENLTLVVLIGVSCLAILSFGDRTERFVLSLPVGYFVFFTLMQTRDERFLLPALALFLLVAGGLPFVLGRRCAASRILGAAAVLFSYGLLFWCLGTLAAESLTIPQPRPYEVLQRPDRLLLDWIEANATPGSAILVESGIVPLVDTLKEPGRFAAELRASVVATRPSLDHRFIGAVYVGGRNYDPELPARKAIDYAIISKRNVQYIESRCDAFPEVCAFYANLRERAHIVFETPPGFEPAAVYQLE